MDARFGPWDSLRAFQERVFGGSPRPSRIRRATTGASSKATGRGVRASDAQAFAGFYVDELRVAADRFRIPPRELQEALPQQVLMLLAADAALAGVKLPDEVRPRTGVFIGLDLDLNTTNYPLPLVGAEARGRMGGAAGAASVVAGVRGVEAGAARRGAVRRSNANRVMGALGSIAASRIARAFHLGGPSFTLSERGNVRFARPGGRGAGAAARRTRRGPGRGRRSGRRRARPAAEPKRRPPGRRRGGGRRPQAARRRRARRRLRSTRWSGTERSGGRRD